ncbi:MAG: thioredoxin-dependent thiol peroxidase [Ignavibacteria bacterium]|nr:thioredoxin-dependent thiol peroxidase [Ignavibacteria bacterium]
MIEVGKKAPSFSLFDSSGVKVSLNDFIGRKVILYFYPKDITPGCTKEACDFRDFFPDFSKLQAVIIGINPDSIESHKKFIEKFNLPFFLLSDSNKVVANKYNVWKEKKFLGKTFMGVERSTFLIDENGRLLKIFRKVKVAGHVDEILKILKQK